MHAMDSPPYWRPYDQPMLRIDLLCFDGCPSWRHAWSDLGDVLSASRIDATVRLCNIDDLPDEQRQGFGGSPTLRINGRDLEGYEGPPVFACRRYLNNEGLGWPDPQQLRRTIEATAKNSKARPENTSAAQRK